MVSVTNKLLAGVALAALFLLAACGGSTPEATQPPAPPATTAPATEATAGQAPAQEATATTAPEPATPTEAVISESGEVSFSRDILPVLQSRCINCHGGQRTSEGLDMKTYAALMAGSQNGSVVTPGDATNSSFVTLAAEGKMPKRGPKLTPAEIKLLTDWVNAGAPNN
jgi:mono/diheme cytochrome c family protein